MQNAIEKLLSNRSIGIPCPKCGEKTKKKIGWLKTHREFACAGCGAPVITDAKKLFGEISKADKTLGKMFRR
ncbi:hypothetical protein ACSVBT_06925 [Afipia sp. TerB]